MLAPSIFGENLFDDFFGDFPFYYDDRAMKDTEKKLYGRRASHIMKTDIKEHDNCYDLMIDLPGVKKEDIKAELNDGYLTVSAESNTSKDEKDDNGKYICRERYSGSYSRSFYVGDTVTEQDISAKFENGTLKLTVPKKESLPEKQNKYIAIG